MNPKNFFGELKRRNVYKVAAAYVVVGWLIVQVATQVFPFFEIPNWGVRFVILAVIVGFPIALVIAWAYELTPAGIKRAEDSGETEAPQTERRTWVFVVIVAAALSIGLFLLGRFSARTGSDESEPPRKSIAVLPFDNLSSDPDNAFFAEGVQDEILTRLSKVADLKVISRTSTQGLKSAPADLRRAAKELGVMHILEGSVQKANDKVRVNVQLVNAMTSVHLWSEIYDRKLTDIFSVESDIAKTIADTLQAKLTGSEQEAISMKPTSDTDAYELYLRGRSYWAKRSGDNLPKAIYYFKQAIGRDPNYALAFAGLADAYILLPAFTGASTKDTLPQAKAAALQALDLDEKSAEAHNALAQVFFIELNFDKSLPEFQRAIELNQNYATAHHWYGTGPLQALGRFEEAIREGSRSIELDPLSPIIHADQGINLVAAGRYDEGTAELRKATALDPNLAYSHFNLGIALELKNDVTGALSEFKKARQLSDDPLATALLANLYAKTGNTAEAVKLLNDLKELSTQRYVAAYAMAIAELGFGHNNAAVDWLEKSFLDKAGGDIAYIKVDKMLDPLRRDLRFQSLVQKVLSPK
jgi:TolB-like protein/tetratricopeptide (TPR) repeat protein